MCMAFLPKVNNGKLSSRSRSQFIQNVAVPEMQIKLRQGFGRAIRTESYTCVIAILDERAGRGRRYNKAMLDALP